MPTPYGQVKPDVRIPRDDQHELENSITREYVDRRGLLLRGSFDTMVEARQCEVNFNDLLDHWPDGKHRGLPQLAVAAVTGGQHLAA